MKSCGDWGKRIKAALVDAGRDQEVAGPFRGRFGEKRGLNFQETVFGQVVSGNLGDLGAQDQVILQQPDAAGRGSGA